jgi:hypothetical protein
MVIWDFADSSAIISGRKSLEDSFKTPKRSFGAPGAKGLKNKARRNRFKQEDL